MAGESDKKKNFDPAQNSIPNRYEGIEETLLYFQVGAISFYVHAQKTLPTHLDNPQGLEKVLRQ